eukprot:TRINITY_DN1342_c0_g4_i1.p1 TRINITY_DN1342_c0_g4~~TRINITY_DN1342_c0_g4_i1.p1  ORF type:complete len:318 (-),score=52.18 TRINITY_DN1342_c0_g4_i1:419-1372(-)
MKIKGKARKKTVIPETEPPNPVRYICENYPDACPVKYRRKIIAEQCDPTHAEFWWARGYWDGVPKEVHEYQKKFLKLNFTERRNTMHINEFIETNYPGIQVNGPKLLTTYFERPEFRDMLQRETKVLQSKIKPLGAHNRLSKLTKRKFLVTWEKVLEYRKIRDETLKVIIQKKQEETQRNKVLEKFQLEVKQARNRMVGQDKSLKKYTKKLDTPKKQQSQVKKNLDSPQKQQSKLNKNLDTPKKQQSKFNKNLDTPQKQQSKVNTAKKTSRKDKKFSMTKKPQKSDQEDQVSEIYNDINSKGVAQHVDKLQSILDEI